MEIIMITSMQAQNKMNELKYNEDAIYNWVRLTHLECLKTQLIYNYDHLEPQALRLYREGCHRIHVLTDHKMQE